MRPPTSSGRRGRGVRESRRHDFPPLWAVPVLFMGGIFVGMYVGMTFGLAGFLAALAVLWWLNPKVDAYVRSRDSAPTD